MADRFSAAGARLFLPGLLLTLLTAAGPLAAQEAPPAGPQTALTASYGFTAQDGPGTSWSGSQSAALGLTARWGQSLALETRLRAPFDGSSLTADGLVQQLALTWTLNEWSVITFGKQRLKWGTARVFSAVDGLEPVYDPAHPRQVLDGVTGMKAEILPNDWLSLAVLVLPAPNLGDSKRALRADLLWEETDLSAGAVHWVAGGKNRALFYADFARFFDRFGLYGEASVKSHRDRDWGVWDQGTKTLTPGLVPEELSWTPQATAGLQVEVPVWLNGTLRTLAEYHFSAEGFDPAEADAFAGAWKARTASRNPAFASGTWPLTVGTFSRHYGYLGISGLPLTEKLEASASLLGGLDTGFLLARTGLGYRVDQQLSVSLEFSRFDEVPGARTSEKLLMDRTVQADLTVSASY